MEDHPGSSNDRITSFSYLGLTGLVLQESQTPTSGGTTTRKDYLYDVYGNRIGMTQTVGQGTPEHLTYGHDPHGSVSTLLNDSGGVKATYGYGPYGETDDDLSEADTSEVNPFNPYRYSGRRFDPGSKSYDMGARRFGPDTSRFLQRDLFLGALDDLSLGMDPLTANRYSLAGGNPVSYAEWDGHVPLSDGGGGSAPAPTGGGGSAGGGTSGRVAGDVDERPMPTGPINYLGARPVTAPLEVPRLPGYGRVEVEIFIMARRTGPLGLLGGDARSFGADAHPSQNRAHLELNYERGRGQVRIYPSCNGDGTECSDALPLTESGLSKFLNPRQNLVSSDVQEGIVKVEFDLLQSRIAVATKPTITGTILLKPRPDKSFDRFIATDAYPSYKVTQTRNGATRSLYRFKEEGWLSLYGISPDVYVCDLCEVPQRRPAPWPPW